jgi:hypothetical protein
MKSKRQPLSRKVITLEKMQEGNDIVRYQVAQKRFLFRKSLHLPLHTCRISDI